MLLKELNNKMIVRHDNIFSYINNADAICFTSNGILRRNGQGICGAGIAKAFRTRFPDPDLETLLGNHIKENGNVVGVLGVIHPTKTSIVSFPTKNDWKHPSSISLIQQSCKQLKAIANERKWNAVALPKPGCSNGGLDWESQVKPIVAHILLDNRFIITDLK